MSKFDDDMARGCLPTGEPLECAYGVGWWTEMPEEEPEPEPELKPCPFCGAMPETDGKLVQCYLMPCDFRRFKMPVESWNTRPIEDALSKRIAELEAEVTKGHELQDSYCDRIAELEDWAYNNFETNNGKDSPNDTQIDALVYGKDSKPLPCPFCGAMEE